MLGDDRATLFVSEALEPGRVPAGAVQDCGRDAEAPRIPLGERSATASIRGVDVFFGPSYSLPILYRGKTVVTIHSVNEVQKGTHPWWYPATYTRIFRASARRADRVIVPVAVGQGRHTAGLRSRSETNRVVAQGRGR